MKGKFRILFILIADESTEVKRNDTIVGILSPKKTINIFH